MAHVVAIRVLDERERVVRDLIHELNTLMIRRVVDAALEHAAPVPVRRHLHTVRSDGIVDELITMITISTRRNKISRSSYLIVLRHELVQALLDDVVAVQVLDQHDDVQAKGDDDGVDL